MTLRPFDEHRDGQTLRAWQDDPDTARWLAAPVDDLPAPADDATRWIFERDGAAVGYGELRDAADGSHALLSRLIVDPSRRRQGLGADLVRALVDRARTRHPDIPVYARIDPRNLPALLAYPSAGLMPLDPLPPGFDERWVWLAALTEAPEVPGGPLDE